MLSSLALHLLLFIILHLAGMGIGKAKQKGDFDLQAIKVVNMIAKAKDKMTRKAKSSSKPSQKRPKARRRKKPLPQAKVRTVAPHRTTPQEVAEKPVFHQPDLPTHEVTQRTIERQMTLAKLVIPKENQLTIDKKIFAEQPKQVDLKQEKLFQKKFEPRKKIKPQKRQIKTPKLLKEVIKKPTTKTIKPIKDATLEIVRKKILEPVEAPERKQFAQVTVRESAPTQERKRQEKQITPQPRSASPKKEIKRTKQVYTPQEVATPTKKVAFNVSPKSTMDRSAPKKKTSTAVKLEDAPKIELELPPGERTAEPLYTLEGTIDGEVSNAFLTVNDVTQVLTVVNGKFEAEIAMVKGNNKVEILVFSSRGGVGKNAFNLLFSPLPGAPMISLDSPENGRQGMHEGDEILVLGTVDDETIQKATLYLNGIPLQPMSVINGVFKRKVFLPNTRTTTFRVMAKSKSGVIGYSPMHTVVSGHDIDLLNPRPY